MPFDFSNLKKKRVALIGESAAQLYSRFETFGAIREIVSKYIH